MYSLISYLGMLFIVISVHAVSVSIKTVPRLKLSFIVLRQGTRETFPRPQLNPMEELRCTQNI